MPLCPSQVSALEAAIHSPSPRMVRGLFQVFPHLNVATLQRTFDITPEQAQRYLWNPPRYLFPHIFRLAENPRYTLSGHDRTTFQMQHSGYAARAQLAQITKGRGPAHLAPAAPVLASRPPRATRARAPRATSISEGFLRSVDQFLRGCAPLARTIGGLRGKAQAREALVLGYICHIGADPRSLYRAARQHFRAGA